METTAAYLNEIARQTDSRRAVPRDAPDVIAILAHEIRNILSPLNTSCELLSLADSDEQSKLQAKGVIGRQLRQLCRLVNDLLDSRQMGGQQFRAVPCRTELNKVLDAIYDDYRPVFASHGIALEFGGLVEPVWIVIDPHRLDQVLNNLLGNSLKFTDPGGSVRLALAIDAEIQRAIISVSDTGTGIAPTAIGSIFDPYECDPSFRNRSGLGLGLPLAKQLVELIGGRLEASSDGIGKGTEFRILLPYFADGELS
jgi:signal transduction histidine kinase